MSKEYEIPNWSSKPIDIFSLEVIKEGILIDNIILNEKEYYLIGRQGDKCDIILEHSSISRIHCILQYKNDNTLYLIDFNSIHGTFINKKEISKNIYHRLFVGDVIKFGASTRLYIVNGPENQRPEEYDSENMRLYRKKLAEKSTKLLEKKKIIEEKEDIGISWGFREDAENYDDDDNDDNDNDDKLKEEDLPDYLKKDPNYDKKYGEKFSSNIKDSEISEKDQAILEKLRRKEKKIQNMQQEISRIYMKENNQDEGLTQGQLAAVERNEKRIAVLIEEVNALEKTLTDKAYQRNLSNNLLKDDHKKINNHNNRNYDNDDNNDDDDRLDTTNETSDVSTNWRLRKKQNLQGNQSKLISLLSSGSSSTTTSSSSLSSNQLINHSKKNSSNINDNAISYEQLCQEKEIKEKRFNSIMTEIQKYEEIIKKTSEIPPEKSVEVDELDKYLLTSKHEEAIQQKKELYNEAQSIMSQLLELEKYIKIAAPALPTLVSHTSNTIPYHSSSSITSLSSSSSPSSSSSTTTTTLSSTTTIKEGNSILNDQEEKKDHNNTNNFNQVHEEIKKPITSKRYISSLAVNSSLIPWDKTESDLETSEKKIVSVSNISNGDGDNNNDNNNKKRRIVGPRGPSNLPSSSSYLHSSSLSSSLNPNELEGGESVWVPPKNQSGDGRTSLNDKYGY